jgi:hypothetical protein
MIVSADLAVSEARLKHRKNRTRLRRHFSR